MASSRPVPKCPPGWRVVHRRGRPTYKRNDGVRVVLDQPGRWGVRFPAHWAAAQLPMASFKEHVYAMEWVNRHYPEGKQ